MNPEQKPIKIEVIKTDIGFYIREMRDFPNHYNGCAGATGLDHLLLDGKLGKDFEKSQDKGWIKIEKLPTNIERIDTQPNINHRYELIDKTLESEKFPPVLEKSKVTHKSDEGYTVWNDEYAQLKSLYLEKSDPQPNLMVNVTFEFNIVLEMDNIKEYGGFSYPIQRTQWSHEGFMKLTDKDVQHNLIDTIIFPDIVLPARKSELTSGQSYKLIRKHVQDNINPKYAHITSDYEFCFGVCKKIPLAQKISYQKDISRWGARKPKYVTDYRENREIQVFEMTHAEHNYKGYTCIEGFKGANIEELKENIDNYLRDLMNLINEPLSDCPQCKGKGVLLNKE
ncbi:MAG: hypothetical protein Q7R95_10545 [bacterium]|nr:hypothetical protein [bacterium]